MLSKPKIALVIILNFTIALGYFTLNINAEYTKLSSDIQNIIPIAQKYDNPELFQKDLYLNDINNVKYYTPFYVQTLRFIAKFTNYNYVQAINVLGFICHLLFGVFWFFLLFKFVNNYWVAFIISIMIRGVVWLPGLEIWGIADLWSIMPRTVYITLMPIPFLLISNDFKKLLFASFLIGLICNYHPITGLGGVLIFITLLILLLFYYPEYRMHVSVTKILLVLVAMFLGVLPFVITYFGKTSSEVVYDMQRFNEAFDARIPEYFKNALLYLKQWLSIKSLFFIIPLFLFLALSFKDKIVFKKARLLVVLALVIIILPTLTIPLEKALNHIFNLNLRMSFQLVRIQKVAVVPGFFAMAFLLNYLSIKFKFKKLLPAFFIVYISLLIFSNGKVFNSVPFIGDDISKFILPKNLSAFNSTGKKELAINKMAAYIINHTKTTDVICGSHVLRGATKRSVIFDGKGASMLIEGNPKQFIEWQERQKIINSFKTLDEVINYLRQFNADYFVTTLTIPQCELIHTEGNLKLYKL